VPRPGEQAAGRTTLPEQHEVATTNRPAVRRNMGPF
jgi:hypothetical protein